MKNLKSIAFAVGLGLTSLFGNGCSNEEHQYEGEYVIDGETLSFRVNRKTLNPFADNILIVKDSTRAVRKYMDGPDDDGGSITVDRVYVSKDGKEKKYPNTATHGYFWESPADSVAIEIAQKQFDQYIKKIKQYKAEEEQSEINEAKELLGDNDNGGK